MCWWCCNQQDSKIPNQKAWVNEEVRALFKTKKRAIIEKVVKVAEIYVKGKLKAVIKEASPETWKEP